MNTALNVLNKLFPIIYAYGKLFCHLINSGPLQFGLISNKIWEKLKCPCMVGAVKTKINLPARLSFQ